MHETVLDLLRKLSREAPPRQTAWRRLRGAIWLDHAQWASGLDTKAFFERFIQRGRSESNLALKWKAGVTLPSRYSAMALEKLLPGTEAMFDLPLYELLADRPLPPTFAVTVIRSMRKENDYGWEWHFPGTASRCFSVRPDDSDGLVGIGSIWSLTAIVALVRQAEVEGDGLSHIELSKNMYRVLPAILRLPWMAPSTELLKDCINQIRARVPLSEAMFDVDWSVIARHTADPAYGASRERRPLDLQTDRPFDFEDPILDAKLIRGSEVKRQQMARERRRER
ncbi:MAG: hypothetical protein RSP_12010 [Rhodanobacter sp.]